VREDDVLAAYTDDDLVSPPCQEVATPSCSALRVEHLRRVGDPLRHGVELEGVREHTPTYNVIEFDSEKALPWSTSASRRRGGAVRAVLRASKKQLLGWASP
jgi:hypothetical protein